MARISPGVPGRTAGAGTVTTFGAGHVHDAGNESGTLAIVAEQDW